MNNVNDFNKMKHPQYYGFIIWKYINKETFRTLKKC